MAAPVVAARTVTLISSDSNSHSINLGSPSAGDLLVVVCSFDSGNGLPPPVIDQSISGKNWWVVSGGASTFSAVYGLVAVKIAEGGGADALAFFEETAEQSASYCYQITGHGSAVFAANAAAFFTANADSPNVAITGSAQDLLLLSAACHDGTVVASAAPSSYGTLTTQAGGANGASISIAERAMLAASSDNPGAFTSGTGNWIAFTIAITSTAITTSARTTQEALEALNAPSPNARASQVALEALSTYAISLVATQVALETLSPQTELMFATQVALEVLSGDPWPSGSNPNKYRQIQIAC